MSLKTQKLADEAIAAFSAWIHAVQAEQDEKLYRADWAEKYGETVRKKQACEILGRSYNYLEKLIAQGIIKVSPDGKIRTRSLQEFAEHSPKERRHRLLTERTQAANQ